MLTYVPRTTFFPRDTLQRICSTSFSAKIHKERERESVGRLGWSALQKRGLGDIIIMAFYDTTR